MQEILERIIPEFELFLLIFMRMSGMFLIFPVFGQRNVPTTFRIGLALLLSYMIMGFNELPEGVRLDTYLQLAYYSISELTVGFVLGYIAILAFSTVSMAGQLIDTHLGFGLVHLLDPQSGMQVSLIGKLKNILAIVVFFSIQGHHDLIVILVESFDFIPAGNVRLEPDIVWGIVELFIYFFMLAMRITIPIIAVSFLVEMMFGIIVRTVPQMNIFVLGIPIKILIGLMALYLLMPVFIAVLSGAFAEMLQAMQNLLRGLALR